MNDNLRYDNVISRLCSSERVLHNSVENTECPCPVCNPRPSTKCTPKQLSRNGDFLPPYLGRFPSPPVWSRHYSDVMGQIASFVSEALGNQKDCLYLLFAPKLTASKTLEHAVDYVSLPYAELRDMLSPAPVTTGGHHYCIEYWWGFQHCWLPLSTTKKPPPPPETRISSGLSTAQAARIGRAADYLADHNPFRCVFITLTFQADKVCHRFAKRCLDVFLKALRRRYPSIDYCWVAELQKRGTIHYHILTSEDWIPCSWVESQWRRIVGNAALTPHTMGVDNPGAYMSKYMAKCQESDELIWGRRMCVSHSLARKIAPKSSARNACSYQSYRGQMEAGRCSKSRLFTGKMTYKSK